MSRVVEKVAGTKAQLNALFDELGAKLKGNFSIDIVVRSDIERVAAAFSEWLLAQTTSDDSRQIVKRTADTLWIATGTDQLAKMRLIDGTKTLPGLSGDLLCAVA